MKYFKLMRAELDPPVAISIICSVLLAAAIFIVYMLNQYGLTTFHIDPIVLKNRMRINALEMSLYDYHDDNDELDWGDYLRVVEAVETLPQLAPDVRQAYDDNIITYAEYADIMDKYYAWQYDPDRLAARKQGYKDELRELCP